MASMCVVVTTVSYNSFNTGHRLIWLLALASSSGARHAWHWGAMNLSLGTERHHCWHWPQLFWRARRSMCAGEPVLTFSSTLRGTTAGTGLSSSAHSTARWHWGAAGDDDLSPLLHGTTAGAGLSSSGAPQRTLLALDACPCALLRRHLLALTSAWLAAHCWLERLDLSPGTAHAGAPLAWLSALLACCGLRCWRWGRGSFSWHARAP
jgi:hypothetical protein